MSTREHLISLQSSMQSSIIGQPDLVNALLVALLADGHLLVEGAPGLAKTKAIKTLADRLEGAFQRIQFTPDLLPADITGSEVYRAETGKFEFQAGPLFHNLILADEINRAPAKVQSALLEAMAERQVSVAGTTYPLDKLFLVMATQNPIEQEGTYPLPEAQLDRFLMHVRIDYPDAQSELQILRLARGEALMDEDSVQLPILSADNIFTARKEVLEMHLSERVEEYIVQLVMATRQPQAYGEDMAGWIEFGASPRATIALDRCARAHAWLAGKDYVSPDDVQAVIHNVLRHRILVSFEAEASGLNSDRIINELILRVAVP
ncbi:MoxR family ATPase [Bermanella marisrubri]|nr:MoxR family ATPase [Bermanella marisrubri]QIZ84521.1 MoxR family ATPase [Bermanella marisrubri]